MPHRAHSSRRLTSLALVGCAVALLVTFLVRKPAPTHSSPPPASLPAAGLAPSSVSDPIPLAISAPAPASDAPSDSLDRLFASALSHADSDRRREVLRAIADYLAEHDPARAQDYLQSILALNDRNASGDAYTFTKIFAGKLAARDPQAVIAWAGDLPASMKEIAFQFAARHWGERDPRALAQWSRTIEDSALRATVVRATAQQLLHADPSYFAPVWAADLARSPDGPRFSDVIARHWAKADPAAAHAWVDTLPDPHDRTNALFALSTTLAEANPPAALSWIAQLPDADTRQRCVLNTVTVWASQDPAAAAAWVTQHAPTPRLVEDSLHPIASAWMQKDPAAATRWLQSAPVKQEMKDYILTTSASRRPNS